MKNENGIFITYSYNEREIVGVEEFQKELEESYPCQGKGIWLPSASEGGEFWIDVFLNIPFWGFIAALGVDIVKDIFKESIVAGGKKYILGPLKTAISNFKKKNEAAWGLKIMKSTFSFNDVEVVIGGLSDEELAGIGEIFMKIHDANQALTKDHGNVVRIEIPAYFAYGSSSWELNDWRSDEESLDGAFWIITYWDDSKALFNSKTGELLDYYSYVPEECQLLDDIPEDNPQN